VLRFEREAQAAGRIGSEHILEIIDLGMLPGGERYMVMEFLDGEPLSARIRKHGRLTPAQLCPLLRQALTGLEAAHRAGIVHRDLKPDNIFVLHKKIGHTDFVKLIDFGISKFNVVGGDMAMTRTGAVMGTPYYMSPEQAKGASNIDARSDLYTMGVIAYEALAGQVPFDGNTFNELMFKIVLSTPMPLAQAVPDTDPRWVAIVEKMMAREVGDRYQSAEEIIAVLDAWSSGASVAIPPPAATAAPQTAAALEVHRPAPRVGTSPDGVAGTKSSWASSQIDGVQPKPRRGLALVAAVAGVLLLAGGALAFKLVSGGGKATAEVTPSATNNAAATANAPVAHAVPAPAPVEAKPVATSEPARAPTAPSSSAAAPAPSASSAPAVAPAAPAPFVRRGSPAPRPKSDPSPSNPSSKSKDREFGY
jgi:serine/threonine protein kinase